MIGTKDNQYYMRQALVLAQQAYAEQEVPVGALLIDQNGVIIGQGYNRVEQEHTQIAHAEMAALMSAGKETGDWRFENCTLFVTLEPCTMCMAAIRLSRVAKVVYGASSFGFSFQLDSDRFIPLYNNDIFLIEAGVLKDECSQILKSFFQRKRNAA